MNSRISKLRSILFFLLLLTRPVMGQELPPVLNFDPNDYQAGNQNWMVSKSENGNVYIANSMGLLEFNGAEWNLYPVPNNTIVRAVKSVGDMIFTGAYMEAGYWKKNSCGLLEYSSLLPLFPNGIHEGEQFWRIEKLGEKVILQSFDGLYLYDLPTGEISVLETPADKPVTNLFKVGKEIYFLVPEDGLYKIQQGMVKLEVSARELDGREVVHATESGEGISIITRNGEFFNWDGRKLLSVNENLSGSIIGISIFSALELPDKSLLLGSVENGIYHTNPEGEMLQQFNQENGLQNNTILSLFLDEEENVWAGLDNGLSILNLNSPFSLFQDHVGRIGTVYTSYQNENFLYLGTNQGLYYRKNGEKNFRFMAGTNGQVWSLQSLDGLLFCGHNNGTFIIEGEGARKISERLGTWVVGKYQPREGYYVQGHYNGFSLLEKTGNSFRDLKLVKNFPHSSKHIVSTKDGDVWIGNEHKGVFRIQLDNSLESISEIRNYSFSEKPEITSSIFSFNDSLYYANRKNIFLYDSGTDTFLKENELSDVFKDVERVSGRMIATGDRVWAFSTNAVVSAGFSQLEKGYSRNAVYLSREHRNVPFGYENITGLDNRSFLLGMVDGYLLFDTDFNYPDSDYGIRIDKVANARLEEGFTAVDLDKVDSFHYKANNVKFHFSIPEYKKFVIPLYSYRLKGFIDGWSEWSPTAIANFKNLPFGEYEFEVKGKVGNQVISGAGYNFSVARPWYLSNAAIAAYILAFLLMLYLIHQVYKREHKKRIKENEKALRMKNLEAEQKIIKLQNEQLEKEMAGKSKELAVSTMSLIKKNEFLTSIRERLKESEAGSAQVRSVIHTIDKDISEEDNWNFFKKAFSNADKDFFKKIKAKHPELTSNDLKLCAYLRLNLTSKEIAPLLNISVKSVEIKRYRLRKKMELSHEINLVDYILEI